MDDTSTDCVETVMLMLLTMAMHHEHSVACEPGQWLRQ